jgi:hypothetical protein
VDITLYTKLVWNLFQVCWSKELETLLTIAYFVSLVVNDGSSLAKRGYTANAIPIELDMHATNVDSNEMNAK